MWLARPAEPEVLTTTRSALEREVRRALEDGRTRGPRSGGGLEHPDIVTALLEMTRHTCTYCDKPLEVDPAAYGWLASTWDNLYPACPDCVRLRGSRFPVRGPRATGPDGLADERPLDPLVDDPDEHLRYQPDGTVTAFTERGRTTHDVLGLNRDSLVRARRALLQQVAEGRAEADVTAFASARRQLTPQQDLDVVASSAGPAWPGAADPGPRRRGRRPARGQGHPGQGRRRRLRAVHRDAGRGLR